MQQGKLLSLKKIIVLMNTRILKTTIAMSTHLHEFLKQTFSLQYITIMKNNNWIEVKMIAHSIISVGSVKNILKDRLINLSKLLS